MTVAFDPKDVKAWREYLDREGFVVLKRVLPKKDVEVAKNHIYDWLESLNSGIKKNDVSTWKNASWPGVTQMGFLPTHGGAHTKASWFIRSHPNVIKAFQNVWDTEE